MSTRLNANLREAIIANALVKAGITPGLEAIATKRAAWSEAARLHVNGISDAELDTIKARVKKAHEQVPKNMRADLYQLVNKRGYDTINLAGLTVRITFGKDLRHVCRNTGTIETGHPLVAQFHAIEDAKKAWDDKRDALKCSLTATLKTITTVKKLLDVWPEAKELLPENLEEARASLPALLISDLNAAIGLPTPEEQAA